MEDQRNGDGDPGQIGQQDGIDAAMRELTALKQPDGILTRAGKQNQSLLHRLITANFKDVPSELKTALFRDSNEADDAVAAYIEARELGLDPEPVLLQICARSAGTNLQLVRLIMEGLTHTTWTNVQQTGKGKPKGQGAPLT